ncbi:50S ribosomal protein L4 [Symmachiella dynata]|uniref:Large ribosomal subunit protein uL4 n=1 Tax=Symmachiella dynata TaxID=2527995 RepID=A0A517ZWV5_9PLAN|nr:50S ribosomal protein L4 [Symmachiella dynata]QDT51202.1 50S ribosomal protein L4 [Symmachiella dynata]QDU46905.1 50S ribosomal protein L4 [Symmachiella dynata]
MISLPIRDKSGQEVGTYEFDPADLAPGVNRQLLHDVVVMYEANRRVGTSATKSRGQVAGSTKKMYRQKGTGRARAGAKRTPVRRGGGVTFGKVTRDFSYRLPKKAVRLATRMALLSKFLDGQAVVLDELSVDAPKTKVVAGVLRSLGLDRQSCLLAIDEYNVDLWKSGRNIADLRVSPAADLNAYDVLRQRQFLVTKAALDKLRGVSAE